MQRSHIDEDCDKTKSLFLPSELEKAIVHFCLTTYNKGKIKLLNTEAGVLQILFAILYLLVDSLMAKLFCSYNKNNRYLLLS